MKYNIAHKAQISQLLHRLGLNDTEKTIYISAMMLGPATISQIAQHSDIQRITTHQAIDRMIEQGIFLETYYGKKRLVYPNNSNGLQLMIEEKKFALHQLEQELESSKSIIDYISTSRADLSQTRLYQGIEGINTTLLEVAQDRQHAYIIYDANSISNILDPKLFEWSYRQRSKNNIHTQLILPESFKDVRHLEWKDDYDVSIRTLPDTQITQGGIEIWGKKSALHGYKEGIITTTIIENKQISDILLMMYRNMRKHAQDYQQKYILL